MVDSAWLWVYFTLLAAFMQTLRTAAQKHVSQNMSAMGATYSRYLFGLPWVLCYLWYQQGDLSDVRGLSRHAWAWIVFGGITQIMGTWALVKVFAWRNFAVGSTFSKTEALQTAIIGALVLGLPLSLLGWSAVLVGVAGIVILVLPTYSWRWQAWLTPVTGLGLFCGFCFAVSALAVYQSSQLTGQPPLLAAALVLAVMVILQMVMVSLWLLLFEPSTFYYVFRQWRWGSFIGICSAAGSVGWFTAMSMQNPALVRTLGQVEFLFSLLLTRYLFGEHLKTHEYTGCSLILLGMIILLLEQAFW